MGTFTKADLYPGSGTKQPALQAASGNIDEANTFPAMWIVGIIIALVLLRVAYELAGPAD